MKIYFYELSEEPKQLHFTEKDAWVLQTIRNTEESSIQDTATKLPAPRVANPCVADFELRRTHNVVFLKAFLETTLGLLCSRCANHFDYRVTSNFQSLFTRERAFGETPTAKAYSEPTGGTEDDLDIMYLEKDYIELADVLKEQIYLKIPFQPLCKEDCKGLCPVCGQDRNNQPCQCHRLKNTALTAGLRKLLK